MVKKDDIDTKLKSRKLYESCFDEGKDSFVDYYYDTIIKRNEMIIVRDNDEIVSMIHLNPYIYNICGVMHNVHYLVAISTKKEYRHRGLMAKCITKALEYLKSLREPFCYLVPDTKELEMLYQKFGFGTVCKFSLDKFSNLEYDIYPEKNEEYIKLMKKEDYFLKFETKEYLDDLKNKVVMFNVLDESNYNVVFFRSKRIYVCQEV